MLIVDPSSSTTSHHRQILLVDSQLPILRRDWYPPRQMDLHQGFGLAIGSALVEGCSTQRQDHSTIVPNRFSSLCECAQIQTNCAQNQKCYKFDLRFELQTFTIEGIDY